MIIDLAKFVAREKPYWAKLEATVQHLEREPLWKLDLDGAKELHYLYERASASLSRIRSFSSDPDLTKYLESLVGRSYGLIHSVDRPARRFSPLRWFFVTFPCTFRRHVAAFGLSAAVMFVGMAFGAGVLAFDPDSKPVIIPFGHLLGDPADRVAKEEQATSDRLEGSKGTFATALMANNIKVSMMAVALGALWGVGTIVLLFYNGVILGAVMADYVMAGQSTFLVGWLLPHGAIEIPAILIAGQGGLVLASALIGRGSRAPLKMRLRSCAPALVTLIFGVALMMLWAGIVESFLSQYHEPVIPYVLKIAFGCVELVLLVIFLSLSGRGKQSAER